MSFSLSPIQARGWEARSRLPGWWGTVARVRLPGDWPRDRLVDALGTVVARHEILRTSIEPIVGAAVPGQRVRPTGGARVHEGPEPGAGRPAMLSSGAELVVAVERGGEGGTDVLLALDALHGDRRSVLHVCRELVAPADGADVLQYADFAGWQEEMLASGAAREGRTWWGSPHAGLTPPLRAATSSFDPRVLPVPWPAGDPLSDAAVALAWSVLAGRLQGSARPTVFVLHEGRDHEGLGDAVGPYEHLLPLECEVAGRSFASLAATVGERLGRARDFAHTHDPRTLPAEAAIQLDLWEARATGFELLDVLDWREPFLLRLEGRREGRRPAVLRLHYDAARVSSAVARALAERLVATLAEGLRAGDRPPLAPRPGPEERAVVAPLAPPSPAFHPLHAVVLGHALPTPDRVALLDGTGELTYGALARRALALAGALRARGLRRGDLCALHLPLSTELVVAMLGVLAAGGAFVPLDPAWPTPRVEALLDGLGRPPCLRPGDVDALVRQGASPVPAVASRPDDLAYGMFTSGSTGVPRLVGVEHGAIGAYTDAVRRRLGIRTARGGATDRGVAGGEGPLSPDDGAPARFAAWTTPAADLWLTALFPALASGGSVVLVDRAVASDGDALAAVTQEREVEVVKTTPSHVAALLADDAHPGVLPARLLVLGGEPLDVALVERIRRLRPRLRLVNHYGPTETAVGVLTAEVPERPEVVPLGFPLAHCAARVLTDDLEPTPLFERGGLALSGAPVARGYLGAPAATAARFVPDPSGGGRRVYRTGDAVVQGGYGEIHFLGRGDDQVKVRGHRVELAEVRHALRAVPGVVEAETLFVPRPVEAASASGELLGFVVLRPGVDVGAVRSALRGRLPDPMVPGRIVALPRLPLTPNGKVDRHALRAVADAQAPAAATPGSELELALAALWARVLDVDPVPAGESFFRLGGHSLKAVRLAAQVQATFGVPMHVRDVFEHPTLLEMSVLVRRRLGTSPIAPPLTRGPPSERWPLGASGARIWRAQRRDPESATYNCARTVSFDGPLDVAALEGAFSRVTATHEMLRVAVRDERGEPYCVPLAPAPIDLRVVDLGDLPPARRRQVRGELARAQALPPFDPAAGLRPRLAVVRAAPLEHDVLLCLHHVVTDRWSMDVIFEDVAGAYADLVRGDEPQVRAPSVRYADFVAWSGRHRVGEALRAQRRYWEEALAGAPVLDLPVSGSAPPVDSAGGTITFRLDDDVTQAVRALAREEGTTPFVCLMAGFQLLLQRYTGQRDFLVGTPTSGRGPPEIDRVVGCFVDTVPLRADLSGDPTFRELVARVKRAATRGWAHQDLPFEEIRGLLPGEGREVRVLLNVQSAAGGARSLPGLTRRVSGIDTGGARADLSLALVEGASILVGALEYRKAVVSDEVAVQLALHFAALLRHALAAPDGRASALPVLSAEEHDALYGRNPPPVPVAPTSLALLVAAAARARPDAIAIETEAGQVSYATLDRLATGMAARLRAHVRGPEARVLLCLDRSLEAVVAMLGAWHAGGAYVPVDPAWPDARVRQVTEEATPDVVVTTRAHAARFPDARLLLVDEPGTAPNLGAGGSRAVSRPRPLQLANLVYTSGSTGRPKGVATPHEALVRLVCQRTYADPAADQHWLQVAPLAFDVSALEVFGPLVHGARLVVAPPGGFSLADLSLLLLRHDVHTVALTAGLFAAMVQGPRGAFQKVRRIFAGGDVVPPDAVRALRSAWPDCRVSHTYGPAECSVFAACERDASDAAGTSVPLGRPLENTRLLVVDAEDRLVPASVPGELLIGGLGLARGYFRRPRETAVRFRPTAHLAVPGERHYATGDRVRFTTAGDLLFLGRADDQVKVNGVRVELDEIGGALSAHPAVEAAVVLARPDPRGHATLTAHVVARAGSAVDERALRDWLRQRLPAPMLPSVRFVRALPLTAHGKVDRERLLREAAEGTVPSAPSGLPLSACARAVAELWEEVLGVAPAGPSDAFFAVGGHSLSAMRLVQRLRDELDVDMPLPDFYASASFGELVARVEELAGGRSAPGARRDGA